MSQWNSTLTRKAPMRRKPLKAVHPSLRAKLEAPKKPRKPLKKVSKSQRRKLADYRPVHREFLARPENEYCHCCIVRREHGEDLLIRFATEIHHKRGRVGALLTDTRFFIPTCYQCGRNWIHVHPALAREYNLLAPASEWNVVPRD